MQVSGYSSDASAAGALCRASDCPLPVSAAAGALCLADSDCPAGSACDRAACGSDADCVNMTGPCKGGKCAVGTCSGGCNSDQDCLSLCCFPAACSDSAPCPNGGKCVGGYKCCGGDGCVADPAQACANNVRREAGMTAFSCGMNTAPVPNDAQTAQLQAACGGKSAGDACSVDFGSQGVYAGSCRSAQGAMTCIQPNLCMAVGGRTSLANPRGICLDTCKSIPELCKS